jgi:hypothetical protein
MVFISAAMPKVRPASFPETPGEPKESVKEQGEVKPNPTSRPFSARVVERSRCAAGDGRPGRPVEKDG